jgi:hypothetical protein
MDCTFGRQGLRTNPRGMAGMQPHHIALWIGRKIRQTVEQVHQGRHPFGAEVRLERAVDAQAVRRDGGDHILTRRGKLQHHAAAVIGIIGPPDQAAVGHGADHPGKGRGKDIGAVGDFAGVKAARLGQNAQDAPLLFVDIFGVEQRAETGHHRLPRAHQRHGQGLTRVAGQKGVGGGVRFHRMS